MNNCSNCTYGNKLHGDAEAYRKLSDDYYALAEETLNKKPSLFGLSTPSWATYDTYAHHAIKYKSMALDIENSLMCNRFPERTKVNKNYLCGEYRKKDAE